MRRLTVTLLLCVVLAGCVEPAVPPPVEVTVPPEPPKKQAFYKEGATPEELERTRAACVAQAAINRPQVSTRARRQGR
jgi:hypothetical protein